MYSAGISYLKLFLIALNISIKYIRKLVLTPLQGNQTQTRLIKIIQMNPNSTYIIIKLEQIIICKIELRYKVLSVVVV